MPRGARRKQIPQQEPDTTLERIGEFLRGDGIPEPNVVAYLSRLERDWAGVLSWLPLERLHGAFLDIGCGLGGHAALLAAHYPRENPMLIDGKENRPKRAEDVKFHLAGAPWINVYRAARLLSFCCGSHSSTWTYPEVLQERDTLACDLVVSFRAWGHHFPVGVYLPLVQQNLVQGGRIVLDVRNGTDGLEQLTALGPFQLLGEIEQESMKCRRFVLEKTG